MSIRALVLSSILLFPIAVMADDEYHHKKGYLTQQTCYQEIYREKYIPGTRSSIGFVMSYLDTVKIPCSSLSWHPPARKHRHHHNHAHYLPYAHRIYSKPTHQQVLVSRDYGASGGRCNASSATTGGLIGGGLAAAISKKDAYGWSIPLGAVLGMGIANSDC